MAATCCYPFLLFLLCFAVVLLRAHAAEGRTPEFECGYPGRPANGSLTSRAQAYYPLERARYHCHDGFVLFGVAERTCQANGSWTGQVPVCDFNLARGKITQQSKTLWNYHADLAADGKPETCSYTPREPEHRWWQVNLGRQYDIAAVAVTISPESPQEFSIFVIELSQGNKASYKECAQFRGVFKSPKALFRCNGGDGQHGQYVYIKDNRKSQAYFTLCEVEVFAFRDHVPCGDPEQPIHTTVTHNDFNAMYSCIPGYFLVGDESRVCQRDGSWSGVAPTCKELECKAPPAIAHGVVEVPGFQGSYRYGQEAQYRCNPGYTIWGNATRFCNARAEWSGEAPTCQKIICAPPPRFENSIYILEDGSTGWNSIVTYHCLEGFVMNRERSNASTVCTDSGDWANVYVECIPGLLLPGPTIVEEASEFINNNNLEESRPEATSASEVISEPDARNQGPNPSTLEVILGLCAVATVVGIAVLILAYLFVKKRKDANYPSEKDFLNEFTSHCSCLERRENLYDEVYTPSASNRESHPDASLEPISIYDNGSRGNSSVAAQSGGSSYDAPSLGNSGYDIPHQHRKRSGSSNHHRHHRHSPRHSPRSSPRHSPRSSPKYENLQFFRTGEQRRYENLILGTARSVTPINTSSPKHPVDATVVTQRHLSSSAKSSSPEPDGPPSSLMMVPASTPLYAQIDKARKRTRRSEAASPDGSSDSGRETADGASPSQPSSLLLPQPSPIIQKDRALEEELVVGPDGEGVNDDTGSSIPDYESLGDPSRGPSRKNSTASSSYLRSLNDSRSLTGPRVMSTFGKGPAETEDTGVKNAGVVAEVKRLIYAQMDVSAPVAGASVQQDRTVYSNIRPSSLKPPSSPLGGNRKKNPPPKVPKKPPHLAGAGSTPPSSLVSTVSGQLKDSIDLV